MDELIDEDQKNNNGEWQQVTYAKKKQQKKKTQATKPSSDSTKNILPKNDTISNVFESLEKNSLVRRKNIEAQRISAVYDDDDGNRVVKSSNHQSENGEGKGNGKNKKNGGVEEKEKKKKIKETKKMNMTVAEAAMKIDAADLASFLADVSASYASQQDIQLMRFADYFGRAFSAVSAAEFPWLKFFKESSVERIADIPVSHIQQDVYKTSVDWINQRSNEALESFVLWSLDSILADLTIQKGGSKGPKKGPQPISSKSQVAVFLVISMTLRQKPDIMINLLPILRENSKYHGQIKLPLWVWMITQASQGDLTAGLYLWAHFILPNLGGKSSSNPYTRDLVLQLVERILSRLNAYKILVNGAVRKGERLITPFALDFLLHLTFSSSSTRVKETDRFEAIYPTLVYVALAGTPRSKSMKQLSLQIQDFALKATREGIPKVSQEATKLLLWCLTQNPECYKQWENIYGDNIETSVAILRKLEERWPELGSKLASKEALQETLKTFRQKNEKASSGGMSATRQALFKEADRCCKELLKKMFFERNGWMITKLFIMVPVLLAFIFTYGYKNSSRTRDFLFN